MKILINASCSKGGGIQVCDGLIRTLGDFREHEFIVCASPEVLESLGKDFRPPENVVLRPRPEQTTAQQLLSRYAAMDRIVAEHDVKVVFTIFGPSYWKPRVPHLCGFAIPHYIYPGYYKLQTRCSWQSRVKLFLYEKIQMHSFMHHVDALVVENPMIAEQLEARFGIPNVHTVYNTCNPVFHDDALWDRTLTLPPFDGQTILTLTSYYPHKNLEILVPTARRLEQTHPDLRFRFVLSIRREQLQADLSGLEEHFVFLDKVPINRCPWLYRQSDMMLLPTLLECFSATWTEAMLMGVPIITSDLPFAHGICEDAALYVQPNSPEKLAAAIGELAASAELRRTLVARGKRVCGKFANAHDRMSQYLDILAGLTS